MSVSLYMLHDASDLDVNIISKSGHAFCFKLGCISFKKNKQAWFYGGGGGLGGTETPQFYANPFPLVFAPNMG